MSRELPVSEGYWLSVSMASPVEMLRSAIDQLSGGSKKWAKGDFHVDGGSCAFGAIDLALKSIEKSMWNHDYIAVKAVLLKTLKDMHPELTANTIPDLNDDPNVTYEDIMAAFQKTALHFEEKVQ